jgi:prepilin-type processing-associated H-X9-DG protein
MYNLTGYWYKYDYSYTYPDGTVYSYKYEYTGYDRPGRDVTFAFDMPNGIVGGFGSGHTASMNVLMCDGSVQDFKFGAKGLTYLFDRGGQGVPPIINKLDSFQ